MATTPHVLIAAAAADIDRRALRRALANRIEACIAALDLLGGDPDAEDGTDAEMTAVEWAGAGAHRFNCGVAA